MSTSLQLSLPSRNHFFFMSATYPLHLVAETELGHVPRPAYRRCHVHPDPGGDEPSDDRRLLPSSSMERLPPSSEADGEGERRIVFMLGAGTGLAETGGEGSASLRVWIQDE